LEDNIKVDVEEIGWDGVDSVHMVNVRKRGGFYKHGNYVLGFVLWNC